MPMLVTTATSHRSKPRPSRRMPPRAVSNTAASTSRMKQHVAGTARTAAIPRSRSSGRRCRCRPCWSCQPVFPAIPMMCAIKRTVVVLPLVPATATTGIRPSSCSANMVEMMASPTGRPLPNDGWRCIRRPGAAFTSITPPAWLSRGRRTLSQTTSTPHRSSPTAFAASTARAASSWWTSSVTSVAEPPVLRLALLRRITRIPMRGTESASSPCLASVAMADVVEPDDS